MAAMASPVRLVATPPWILRRRPAVAGAGGITAPQQLKLAAAAVAARKTQRRGTEPVVLPYLEREISAATAVAAAAVSICRGTAAPVGRRADGRTAAWGLA